MSARLVVLGSVNMDLVLRCRRLPAPGETVMGDDLVTVPGGKGANQAVAAARMGAEVSFIGCVGDDAFGSTARRALAADGIDTTHLHTLPGTATGVAMILVEDSGQNCITLAGGANAGLDETHVRAAGALIDSAALLVCQLESPPDAVAAAVERAHAAGVPVLLNPAPARPLPADLLTQVNVLVPNEHEARALLGMAPTEALDAAAAAGRLRALGPRTVIVTLGAQGVQVADVEGNRHAATPAVQAVDTTGAGDTFVGAYAAGRCAGLGLDAAVALAQRAAAISVTRPGAMAAMPHRRELGE